MLQGEGISNERPKTISDSQKTYPTIKEDIESSSPESPTSVISTQDNNDVPKTPSGSHTNKCSEATQGSASLHIRRKPRSAFRRTKSSGNLMGNSATRTPRNKATSLNTTNKKGPSNGCTKDDCIDALSSKTQPRQRKSRHTFRKTKSLRNLSLEADSSSPQDCFGTSGPGLKEDVMDYRMTALSSPTTPRHRGGRQPLRRCKSELALSALDISSNKKGGFQSSDLDGHKKINGGRKSRRRRSLTGREASMGKLGVSIEIGRAHV